MPVSAGGLHGKKKSLPWLSATEVGIDAGEHGVERTAQRGHGYDDRDGDERGEQAVFDGRGTFLVFREHTDEGSEMGHFGYSTFTG